VVIRTAISCGGTSTRGGFGGGGAGGFGGAGAGGFGGAGAGGAAAGLGVGG